MCDECETYHCAGCEHPSEYLTHRFAPLPCGCVEQRCRRVVRTYGLRGRTTVTHYTQPISRCATHRVERVQREMNDYDRRDAIMTGGRGGNITGD